MPCFATCWISHVQCLQVPQLQVSGNEVITWSGIFFSVKIVTPFYTALGGLLVLLIILVDQTRNGRRRGSYTRQQKHGMSC